ncbi:hypothetical protein DBR06_SOUSAS57710002, partial [Sousa chinensis]
VSDLPEGHHSQLPQIQELFRGRKCSGKSEGEIKDAADSCLVLMPKLVRR